MLKSIEFNWHSQKWEVHAAEKVGSFIVVGEKLAEVDSREKAESLAKQSYLPSRHPQRPSSVNQ